MGALRRLSRAPLPLFLLLMCAANQACMQRITGYSLQGRLRIGWCEANGVLRIDSQNLGRILVQRCISVPLLPIALLCTPSRGLESALVFRSLVSEQLEVVIEGYELVAGTRPISARLESDLQTIPRMELPPRGVQMLVFNFTNDTDAQRAELVIRGSVQTATGVRQGFECRAQLVRRHGAWEWNNPFVAVD